MQQTAEAIADNPYAEGAAFVDGDYCPLADARIPLTDLGFIRSDTTYDVVHVWKGRFFRLDDHLDRFRAGCAKLKFDLPYSKADMAGILHQLVRLTGLEDVYVSITASRGTLPKGTRNPLECRNRLYAFAIPFMWIAPPEEHEAGIDMIVATPERVPMTSFDQTVKNYQWGDLTRSMIEAGEQGAKVAVLLDRDGNVTEGAGFNVFALKDGVLHTAETGVLQGISRMTAIELAGKLNVEVRIAAMPVETLRAADEIFITSTAGGIMPVRSLDGEPVGDGAAGPLSLHIRKLYWQAHDDPALTTPVDPGR